MDLVQCFISFLIEKTSNTNKWIWTNSGVALEKKELAKEFHKPVIRNFGKRKVHSRFIDNIWGADLADMQLLSKFNKGICFLLCVIDVISKYAWIDLLKDKKGITITNAFQKILDELLQTK